MFQVAAAFGFCRSTAAQQAWSQRASAPPDSVRHRIDQARRRCRQTVAERMEGFLCAGVNLWMGRIVVPPDKLRTGAS